MVDARVLVDQLRTVEGILPPGLRAEILACGLAAEAPLLALAEDDDLINLDSEEWFASIHAINLLVELGCHRVIPRILHLYGTTDCLAYEFNLFRHALLALGPLAVDPCIQAFVETPDEDFASHLRCALADLGVRDERIYDILIDSLAYDAAAAAGDLQVYGDLRAVPHLVRALARFEIVDSDDRLANHEVIQLLGAIEHLRGTLTVGQRKKLERALGRRFRLTQGVAGFSRGFAAGQRRTAR